MDCNFFLGARYDAAGNCNFPGYWRERIEYVKVNIVRDGGPTPPPSLSGTLY